MTSQYINQIQNGAIFEVRYDPLGNKNQIIINDGTNSTFIPKGNSNFDAVLEYIESNNLLPEIKLSWVQVITDNNNNTLFFRTDKGEFADNQENLISRVIKEGINNGTLEVREVENPPIPQELEINVFMRRAFRLDDLGSSPLPEYTFNSRDLGLPFDAEIKIIQAIEPDFFTKNEWVDQYLKYTKGNVLRIYVNKTNIKSIYNWCKTHLDQEEQRILNESINIDLALFKRNKSHGPRTAWYFDWINLQSYVWVLIIHISNRMINLVNLQADRRKTISLLSRDDLGDTVCIKAINLQNEYFLWLISSLQDQQITIFPRDLAWKHNMLDLAFFRVRFLIGQGLYFEAIVVTQAILESIINGLFPTEVIVRLFNKRELKWEQKYKYLKEFYKHHLSDESILYSYFDGGLKQIYEYRNSFSHDVLIHQPEYLFDIKTFKEISALIKPFTDYFEKRILMSEVNSVYEYRNEFLNWLKSRTSSD